MRGLAVRRDLERDLAAVVSLVLIPAVFAALGAYAEKLKEINTVSLIPDKSRKVGEIQKA